MSDILLNKPDSIKDKNYLKRLSFLLMFIAVLFLSATFFFRFPDSIYGDFSIITIPGPYEYFIKGEQSVDSFFVENGVFVRKGDILFSNASKFDFSEFKRLEHWLIVSLDSFSNDKILPIISFDSIALINESPELFIGALKTFNEYNFALSSNLRESERILESHKIIAETKRIKRIQIEQQLLDAKLKLASHSLERQKELYTSGAISKQEYENIESSYFNMELEVKRQETSFVMGESSIRELQLANEYASNLHIDKMNRIKNSVSEKLSELLVNLNELKNQYLVKATMDGYFFKAYIQKSDNGENKKTAIIVPNNYAVYGTLNLEMPNIGMLKIGQKSRIEINQYESSEFGSLLASVESIIINDDGSATVLLKFENGLRTTEDYVIEFNPFLTGRGEVIVKDRTLIEEILGW